MPISIKIKNLNKSFGEIQAVKNFELEAYPSQVIALLGPNGAGKSTLMKMIAGFLACDDGEIILADKNVKTEVIEAQKNIGFLPEGSPLYYDMSVKNFLRYMAELKKAKDCEVNRVMKLANVEEVKDQKIDTLSKGYKRRVGFAQSIIGDPKILLLDEPTDGLDPNQKAHILGLIEDMSKDKTIIISTHLLDEAQNVANRIIIMDKGQIKADGELDAILKTTQTTSLENAFVKLTR